MTEEKVVPPAGEEENCTRMRPTLSGALVVQYHRGRVNAGWSGGVWGGGSGRGEKGRGGGGVKGGEGWKSFTAGQKNLIENKLSVKEKRA